MQQNRSHVPPDCFSISITPLHLVWYSDIAECLINHGADINARDNNGKTPLQWAKILRRPKMAEWLIEHDATTE